MEHDGDFLRESTRVIDEVEGQLDRLLQKKFGDVDRGLEELINREREAALRRKDEIEKEFQQERQVLVDYRAMVREFEEERGRLLSEARERFDKVLRFQEEIDSLARSTVAEIKKVNEIQDRLEGLRTKTSEKAAFLKNDLREKFGIVAEVMEDEPKPLDLDLDQELEKLRKIKELLAAESAAADLGMTAGQPAARDDLAEMDAEAGEAPFSIPEIQDLVAGSAEPEIPGPDVPESPAETTPPETPVLPAEDEEETEGALAAELETRRRTEPANGSGEIHYFQKDRTVIIDPEKLFESVDKTLEEAGRLSLKLGLTESPKDQFFIKQELINWQEGLRGLLLRIIKMCEKSAWGLPSHTREILDTDALRGFLERLSMENWSNPEEFASFSGAIGGMRRSFLARIEPRIAYLRSLRQDLDVE
ncbi:MAG: hypothetical protein R6X21_04445 [Candidatus Aminicenantes bacterium]